MKNEQQYNYYVIWCFCAVGLYLWILGYGLLPDVMDIYSFQISVL